jgi:hypothetical protein
MNKNVYEFSNFLIIISKFHFYVKQNLRKSHFQSSKQVSFLKSVKHFLIDNKSMRNKIILNEKQVFCKTVRIDPFREIASKLFFK